MTPPKSPTGRRIRRLLATGAVLALATGLAACRDDDTEGVIDTEGLPSGVTYREFDDEATGARVHLLEVDLASPGVAVEAVTPGLVSDVERPTVMAEAAGAAAVVNGDFFNNRADGHPLAPATNAPVGPLVIGGEDLSAAVPDGQRMGPSRSDGHNEYVLALTADGRAEITTLTLEGTVRFGGGEFDIAGLNQYAIGVDSIGVFTDEWGWGARMRAVCGVDDERRGPCSESVREVTVAGGEVVETADFAGGLGAVSDPIGEGRTVFVARDGAAADLYGLAVGDPVEWEYELVAPGGTAVTTAIGGMPLLVDGEERNREGGPGDRDARTAAGHSGDGRFLYLAVIDGANLFETADILSDVGATSVVNLDGGGSSVMGLADADGAIAHVNDTFDATGERMVANALLVFADEIADERPAPSGEETTGPAGVGGLEGTWNVVAESPGQASTLTVDASGHATYTSEGTLVDYWEGAAVPVDGAGDVFAIDFEAFGEYLEADPEEYAFSVQVALADDGDTLTWTWDGYESTYTRAG